ncbi:MAG: hypothetical protein IKO62_08150 [Bacteroidales bacterium]|nr:hypothetical protein [Bacteroidales bacterium]
MIIRGAIEIAKLHKIVELPLLFFDKNIKQYFCGFFVKFFDKNSNNTFAAVALTSNADLLGQKYKQACFCPFQISILSAAKEKTIKTICLIFHIIPQIFVVKEKHYAIFPYPYIIFSHRRKIN